MIPQFSLPRSWTYLASHGAHPRLHSEPQAAPSPPLLPQEPSAGQSLVQPWIPSRGWQLPQHRGKRPVQSPLCRTGAQGQEVLGAVRRVCLYPFLRSRGSHHWLLLRPSPWLLRWLEQNLEKVLPQPPKPPKASGQQEGPQLATWENWGAQGAGTDSSSSLSPGAPEG